MVGRGASRQFDGRDAEAPDVGLEVVAGHLEKYSQSSIHI